MHVQIRRNVFETNSSSSHSVSYSARQQAEIDFAELRAQFAPNGIVKAKFGEFGWGENCLCSFDEKLSYVITEMAYDGGVECDSAETFKQSEKFQWLAALIKETLDAELDIVSKMECNYKGEMELDTGYIDHQSIGMLANEDYWGHTETEFKANMRRLLFDDAVNIIIDNDNH